MCPAKQKATVTSRFSMSIKKACQTFCMSSARLHRLISEHKIEYQSGSGGSVYIDPVQVQEYLNTRKLPGYCTVTEAAAQLPNRKITKSGIYYYIRNDLVKHYRDGGEIFIELEDLRRVTCDVVFACEACKATLQEGQQPPAKAGGLSLARPSQLGWDCVV